MLFVLDIPSLTLTIKNVMPEEIDDYLKGGKKRTVLDGLLGPHFFPIEMGIEVRTRARTMESLPSLHSCVFLIRIYPPSFLFLYRIQPFFLQNAAAS